MSIFPTSGQQRGFRGLRVERDIRVTDSHTDGRQQIPLIKSNDLPPPTWAGIGGGIAYDVVTKVPYYSDGFTWLPIGGTVGTVESYAFIKDHDQVIPRATDSPIAMWESTSSTTYHTIPGWDLNGGIYSAPRDEDLTIEANISWTAGVSNLGDRILRVEHMTVGVPVWTIVKEVVTQADADLKVETTQECQMHLRISQGDAVRVTVEHNSPIPVKIGGGVHTSLSGFRVNTQ